MARPSPSWDTVSIRGRWSRLTGAPETGRVLARVPVRVTSATDDVIFMPGVVVDRALDADGRLVIDVPASDDPDISPHGWQVTVVITFTDGRSETYVVTPRMADIAAGINLRAVEPINSVVLPPAQVVVVRGRPGGIAELDADGDVVNADGVKVLPGSAGGGAGGGSASGIGVDDDGTPYYAPTASGAALAADDDGTPYFEPSAA